MLEEPTAYTGRPTSGKKYNSNVIEGRIRMKEPVTGRDTPLFDADGFFREPDKWTTALAERIAEANGLGPLSPEQIALLHKLRGEFEKSGSLPAFSHVCHLEGQAPDCLQQLFPSPLEAWRLAGLPNPGEEAKAYMSPN